MKRKCLSRPLRFDSYETHSARFSPVTPLDLRHKVLGFIRSGTPILRALNFCELRAFLWPAREGRRRVRSIREERDLGGAEGDFGGEEFDVEEGVHQSVISPKAGS